MGPTWHSGRPMTSTEYKVVKKVWLGNERELCNFKEAALLKRCWFARGRGQFMIWRRADFVDPFSGILLFGQDACAARATSNDLKRTTVLTSKKVQNQKLVLKKVTGPERDLHFGWH
jgi:hypothetical protein